MAIIETSNLQKSFRVRKRVVEAVRGVDIRVEEGEIFGFLGPNGAGKTTTQRILTTLLEPGGGKASVAGFDLLREPERVRPNIGYVSQTGGADRMATSRENLLLSARLYGINKTEALKRTAEMLRVLDLETFADRLVITYSGGQRRRLDLAMGLIHRPKLLFLDEPTTGLDLQSRARLWDAIRALRTNGTTIFLTTHYLEEADALCDRLAIIDNGRIVAEGTPDELKRRIAGDVILLGLDEQDGTLLNAQNLFAILPFIRESQVDQGKLRLYVERGEEALPIILRQLDEAGLPIHTLSLARPSLDDVFLKQTGRSLRESTN
jgi:ABC-2 type transport system ATP-binding protein